MLARTPVFVNQSKFREAVVDSWAASGTIRASGGFIHSRGFFTPVFLIFSISFRAFLCSRGRPVFSFASVFHKFETRATLVDFTLHY